MISRPAPSLRGFETVIFDCDSTLTSIEGIDELAGPFGEQIQALTDAAMDGVVPLQEVYGRRLEIIRPTREHVEALGRLYVERLVEDAADTVAALLWLSKTVRIVSGGLLPPVEALALELGLRPAAVAAVPIQFSPDGAYLDFERTTPLARSGGKAEVIRAWSVPRRSVLVGDGVTDLEARPAVDCFVAYMGVVERPAVSAAADIVLRAPSLSAILALTATPTDRARLAGSPWADLLERGDALLLRAE